MVAGVSSPRCGDRSLPQLSHEGQILLVHPSLVLCRLRRFTTSRSVGSKRATENKIVNVLKALQRLILLPLHFLTELGFSDPFQLK